MGIVGKGNLNESGDGNRLGVVVGRWAGRGAERKAVLSKDVVV